MSQKKHKKRRPQHKRPASAPAAESEFSSDGKRKRMNRTSRNILLATLVLLAVVQLCTNTLHIMGDDVANLLSLVGLVLLLIALWFQFRDPTGGGQSGAGAPRLR